jgi:hypothetical protein
MKNQPILYATEMIHGHALGAFRRAVRAGDIVLAERWMRIVERHYRVMAFAEKHRDTRLAERKALPTWKKHRP